MAKKRRTKKQREEEQINLIMFVLGVAVGGGLCWWAMDSRNNP